MFEHLKELYEYLPLHFFEFVMANAQIRALPKGEVLIHADTVERNIYLVVEGMIRGYRMTEHEPKTVELVDKFGLIIRFECVLEQKNNELTFEALEDSQILFIPYDLIEAYEAQNMETALAINKFLKRQILMVKDRLETHIILSPLERYVILQNEHPALTERVPLKYLASYLGVTPESLSRIRSRLSKKKS